MGWGDIGACETCEFEPSGDLRDFSIFICACKCRRQSIEWTVNAHSLFPPNLYGKPFQRVCILFWLQHLASGYIFLQSVARGANWRIAGSLNKTGWNSGRQLWAQFWKKWRANRKSFNFIYWKNQKNSTVKGTSWKLVSFFKTIKKYKNYLLYFQKEQIHVTNYWVMGVV